MKRYLLIISLFLSLASRAQYGNGFDQAMNFGGAGSTVTSMEYDGNGNLYFTADILGKAFFAGQEIDGGAYFGFPDTKHIFGKISSTGTQTLLKAFKGSISCKVNKTGEMYGLIRSGSSSIPVDYGDGFTDAVFGAKIIKISNTGVTQFIKPINTGASVQYGNSGIAILNVERLQFTPDGYLYAATSAVNPGDNAPDATFKYPHRIIKFTADGTEVWHSEIFSAGQLEGYSVPEQFVDDNGKVTFGILSASNQWYYNGESITSQMSVYGASSKAYSIVISLKTDGSKDFAISDAVYPVTLSAVNPTTGELYINYSALTTPTKAPFNTLPNQYPVSQFFNNYIFSGLLKFSSSGTYTGFTATTDFKFDKMLCTANGFITYEKVLANNIYDKGDYVFNSTTAFGVLGFYDQNFSFSKSLKVPVSELFAADQNKVSVGGIFTGNLTFGNTTLTGSYNDPTFGTRFPSFASVKADMFIARADMSSITPPTPSTWLGIDNNWNNTANWSNGTVPDINTIVKFNTTTAQQPTTGTSPTALKVVIDAGVTASLPSSLVLKNRLVVNGTLQLTHTGAYNFMGYSATAVEGSGTLSFTGTSSPSASIFVALGSNFSLVTNEPLTVSGTFKNISLTGSNAYVNGTIEITNADPSAITGYSSTNYISGKLTRAVNATGTYVFPTKQSSGTPYEPTTVTLNNLTGPSKITVANNNGPTSPNLSFATGTCTTNLGNYYWQITPDVAPTSGSYDVSFQKSTFTNGVTDPNRYVVLKRIASGEPWTFEGTKTASTQTGGTTNGSVVSNALVTAGLTGLTKFSDFVIGINSTAVATNTAVTASTWTGASNTSWNNAANWSNGIPNATVDATIPSGLSNYPLVYTTTDNARSLIINTGITGLRLSNVLLLTNGLNNNSDIEIAKLTTAAGTFNGFGGGISGSGKIRFETTSGITDINAGVVNNAVDINIGNANSINVLGKFGNDVNLISGLARAWKTGTSSFEITSPTAVVQVTAPLNHLAAEIFSQKVNTTGTYVFPIGDHQFHRDGIRKYGQISITNNNIAAATTYGLYFDSYFTEAVAVLDGSTAINSFINSGQWTVTPTLTSTTGTVDLILKTSNYTNGRTSVADYVLLRRDNATTPVWAIVPGAVISETSGVITVTANGLAPFSTSNTKFCIGLKSTTTTWTGTTSTNWNTASNWSNGVPSSSVKAVFGTASRYPSPIPTSNPAALIEIQSGATLVLPQSFTSPLGIINNGTIEVSGTGIFYGFGSGTSFTPISGTGRLLFSNNSPATLDSYYTSTTINNSIEVNRSAGLSITRSTNFTGSVNLVNGIVTMGSGQVFNMTNPNATITSTTSSYINGTLNRIVNASGSYSFPVGSSANAAPLTLNLTNITGVQSIRTVFSSSINGATPNVNVNGLQVTSLLNSGFWTVTPNASLTGGSYEVLLQGNGFTNGSANPTDYVVLKRDASYTAWGSYGTQAASSQTAGTVTASASGITGFSDFAIGILPTVLPVKLVDFEAKTVNNIASLTWKTLNEKNTDKFVIERSLDGTTFVPIGELKGQIISDKAIDYNYQDYTPFNGINYYRLKQLDLDGKFEYSAVKSASFTLSAASISIFPNPVSEVLYVSGFDGDKFNVKLYRLDGSLAFEANSTQSQINVPALSSGLYSVKITGSKGQSTLHKLVVKN